jgi:elongation factor P
MASTSEIRKGVVIKHQNNLYLVTKAEFVNPGKGSAFTRTRMKSLTTNKTVEITYKSSESVDIVEVQNKKMQFLYKSGDKYAFMEQDTYEIYELSADVLGDDAQYLKEGLDVFGVLYNNAVVAVALPPKVQYKVKEAPPAVKGDTATSGRMMKDIILENGLKVKAPIFIKDGETVLINTEDGSYCERINQ